MANILVVAAESDWSASLLEWLESKGHDIMHVVTDAEARAVLADKLRRFGLVIVDVDADRVSHMESTLQLLDLGDHIHNERGTNVLITTAYGWKNNVRELVGRHAVYDFVPIGEFTVEFTTEFGQVIAGAVADFRRRETPAKILLIEDNLQWQRAIIRLLQKAGHQVFLASTEEEARDIILSNDPQYRELALIITDLRLNEWQEGFEGVGLIRLTDARYRNDGTLVIVITAYGWVEESKETFGHQQVYDFLPKDDPGRDFSDDFLDVVHRALELYRESRA